MYQAIVFLPLLGALLGEPVGLRAGARAAEILTTGLLLLCAALSWAAFFQVGYGAQAHALVVPVAQWLKVGDLDVSWALRIDALTATMLVVVTSVSGLVHLYSIGYMAEDPSRPRFFSYLSLFTFAMLMLVTADNLVQMFFGWEGVGLASYLLIGFWYEKPSANAAAIKAFVVNRVGDFGFALGIFLVFALTKSVSFDAIFAAAPGLAGKSVHAFGMDVDALTLACLLLFMGAMGKSAQFLLHTWLPDAMEGPTPVSALIHAATMVTAGVFMVARLSPLFAHAPAALGFVTAVGATTALFAATVGLVQNDIKRVIAYSTCSQLGYMFVALGVGAYGVGIFHLFTHAFFKALLFLGAGSVIHAMHHEQDMRNMGGLRTKIPLTFWAMTVGTLALTGFPFTAGYYSKDAIIEAAYAGQGWTATYGFLCTVVAAGLTSFYSWRLVFMTFFGEPRAFGAHAHDDHAHGDDAHAHEPHESPATMLVPLALLSLGALAAGFAFHGAFVAPGAEAFWKGSIADMSGAVDAMEKVPGFVSLLPTLMMVGGFLVAYAMYVMRPGSADALAKAMPLAYRFLLNKWYFDELYDFLFVRPAFWLGRLFWKGGDGRIIDGFGPDGVSSEVLAVSGRVVRLQSGYVYHYAFAMMLGIAAIITWYLFMGVR
ncbi:MAG: NADH-quinone oxidoreductase subunit L [Hyphomicrobiales bacterium]|nr:NADH-quinone oxidoreductase subunit L [Hyphomicrobiales bacterium]MDE2018248.1 NADH-quinone oxidoreductase subunit L [Hyphomicrobiales bacterium]